MTTRTLITSFQTIGRKLQQASNWIDAKFFPLPVTKEHLRRTEQQCIEDCAGMITKQIAMCRALKDTYDAFDGINDFKIVWGDSDLVRCWYDSLLLDLHKKQVEVSKQYHSKS